METKFLKRPRKEARTIRAEICSIELQMRELELRKSLLAVELRHASAIKPTQSILYPQAA